MTVRLAIMGAGYIGRKHAVAIANCGAAQLAAILDLSPEINGFADSYGAKLYQDFNTLLASDRPDGILIATPSALHVDHALACIDAGIPLLVEKPLATDLTGARRIVTAAEAAGVPLAVGHHRRHNPIVAAAAQTIAEGRLGRITAVHAFVWLMKPAPYFDLDWRRQPGAGPILTNLIHDIDLMRAFCGDIKEVQAMASDAIRGHAVEDSAVLTLRFASGALGTVTVSDTAAGPWSWEMTAAENPDYPATGQSCYHIAGTDGALELPNLRLWRYPGKVGWHEPLDETQLAVETIDPLEAQIIDFVETIKGARPRVGGRDGVAAMEALDAVMRAVQSGGTVEVGT